MPARALGAVVAAAALAGCGPGDDPPPPPPPVKPPLVSSELACRIAPDVLVSRALDAPRRLADQPQISSGTISSSCSWSTGRPGAVRERLLLTISAAKDFDGVGRGYGRVRKLEGIGDAAFVAGSEGGTTAGAGIAAGLAGRRTVTIFLNDARRNRSATPEELRALAELLRASVRRLPR